MENAIEQTTPIVTSGSRANYPFNVQTQNTENWNSAGATVTLEAAMEIARDLAAKHPALPIRIEHCTGGPQIVSTLPVFKCRDGAERPYRQALWTGKGEPPVVGARVNIRVNSIGMGTVTGYCVEGGYLGLMVLADDSTRPEWHKRQNPKNEPYQAFGAELKED